MFNYKVNNYDHQQLKKIANIINAYPDPKDAYGLNDIDEESLVFWAITSFIDDFIIKDRYKYIERRDAI